MVMSERRQVGIDVNRFSCDSSLGQLVPVAPMNTEFAVPLPEVPKPSPVDLTPQRITNLLASLPLLQDLSARRPYRMAIKTKGKIVFIDATKVISIQAKGNRVWLHEASATYALREPISTVALKLAAHGFVRIHRSVMVNAAFVREIQPWPTGEYVLRMEGGKEYTVTRTYKKNLTLLAESWIGTAGFAPE